MKRKFLIILSAMCMAVSLTGCGDSGGISGETAISSESTEAVLPPNMTMDDLLNIMQINGKAVELPLTVNELMEFDDKFSYEVFMYIDENSREYAGKNAFFTDVKYDDKFMFTTIIYSEKEDRKKMLDLPMSGIVWDKDFCKDAGIDITLDCGIDFNSTHEDIEKIFGSSNTECTSDQLKYWFNDNEYSYFLTFNFDSEVKNIDDIVIGIYDDIKKERYEKI